MPDRKPMLTAEQQIAHLEGKGITFEPMSKADAANYLTRKNNFLRVVSHRETFDKQLQGDNAGKYLNLDFAYLVDLASIDRALREVMLSVTLDIEHFAKVGLLNRVAQMPNEDGYSIVKDFVASLPDRYRKSLESELRARTSATGGDPYSGLLIAKYQTEMPAWVLLEVISFGMFLTFCRFCAQRWDDAQMLYEYYLMKQVKALRNASAHGACTINCFRPGLKSKFSIPVRISDAMGKAAFTDPRAGAPN